MSLKRGNTLHLFGIDNTAKTSHIIAAVLYVLTEDGTYLNWLAVINSNFDKGRFGRLAMDKPFQNMGLATFLLHMIQIQALARQWSIILYLQANLGSIAFIWYENCGFKKVDNDPSLLPDSLLELYNSFNNVTSQQLYVHFATTEELETDAKKQGSNPESTDTRADFMNLLKLTGPLVMNGCASTLR